MCRLMFQHRGFARAAEHLLLSELRGIIYQLCQLSKKRLTLNAHMGLLQYIVTNMGLLQYSVTGMGLLQCIVTGRGLLQYIVTSRGLLQYIVTGMGLFQCIVTNTCMLQCIAPDNCEVVWSNNPWAIALLCAVTVCFG